MGRSINKIVFFIFAGILLTAGYNCTAQNQADSLRRPVTTNQSTEVNTKSKTTATDDTVAIPAKPKKFQPNPKKAGLYSAIVPGLGQLYNRQYLKIPLVYAGIGVAGYFFFHNNDNYQSYRKAYIGRINNPYPTDKYVNIYSNDQLQTLQNDYKKYLDMTVLFSSIGYALQVIDAITSAHLKNFDISRDISMRVLPVPYANGMGMGIVMNLK